MKQRNIHLRLTAFFLVCLALLPACGENESDTSTDSEGGTAFNSDTASDSNREGSSGTDTGTQYPATYDTSDDVIDVGEPSGNGTIYTQENSEVCKETCDYLQACDGEQFEQCDQECAQMAVTLRQSALDQLTECIVTQSCTALSTDECFIDIHHDIPDSVVDELVVETCKKMNSCDPSIDIAACELQNKSGDDGLNFLKVMNDNVLNCFGKCVKETSCELISKNLNGAMEACFASCDVTFGDDDEDHSSSRCDHMAGDWIAQSVSCSGLDLDISNITLTQSIDQDCQTELTAVTADCVISWNGEFEYGSNGMVLQVVPSCGIGCDDSKCTPGGIDPYGIEVSIDVVEGQLTESYNVEQHVLDANFSPCPLGSQHLSVFVRQ